MMRFVLFSTLMGLSIAAHELLPVAMEVDAPEALQPALRKALAARLERVEGVRVTEDAREACAQVALKMIPVQDRKGRVVSFSVAGTVTSSGNEQMLLELFGLLRERAHALSELADLASFLAEGNRVTVAAFHQVGQESVLQAGLDTLEAGVRQVRLEGLVRELQILKANAALRSPQPVDEPGR